MDQPTPTAPSGGRAPHPVIALRDQLTQAHSAADQLRAILARLEDPGRRIGEPR